MKMSIPPQGMALLNTIAGPESGQDYNVVYGGQAFDDYSDHPRVSIPIKSGPNAGKTSSAAGKYQFLEGTWDQYSKKLGLKDFSPKSQDQAAWALAQDAYKDATGGDLTTALSSGDPKVIAKVGKALSPVWTSLPGGIEQGTNSNKFVNAYVSHLENPTSGAVAAVNGMANGTLPKPNKVQSVSYVAPPFSGEKPHFAPLLGNAAPPAKIPDQKAYHIPVEAPAEPVKHDDVIKAWGLGDVTPPAGAPVAPPVDATSAKQPTASTQAPTTDVIKAWGLDKTDAAPAETLAKAPESAPAQPGVAEDVIKAGASGLARGAADTIGLPGTVSDLINNGLGAALHAGYKGVTGTANLLMGNGFTPDEPAPGSFFAGSAIPPSVGSGEAIRGYIGKASDGATDYKAQTTPGKYVGNAAEFVPSAVAGTVLTGGGNLLLNATKFGVVPGLASEAAGQATEGTAAEPWARLGGALLAPAAVEGGLRGITTVGNKLASMTPTGAAARNLNEAVSSGTMTTDQIAAEMARNPRLTPMDLDPNLQQMAMNLANQGGAPRATLNSVVENRMAGAKDAVSGAFDDALGATPDVQAYLTGLKTTARTNAAAGFGEALNNAKPVNLTPVLESIDSTLAPGVQASLSQGSNIPVGPVEQALAKVRAQLGTGDEMLTDPQRLHQIQSQLRIDADTLAKSSSGQDKLVAAALRDVRGKIVGAIDEASGGKYKPAQQQYADDMSIQDSFDKGRQILSNGTSSDAALENRPEFWRSWMASAPQADVDAAKVGARVAIDNQINSVRSASAKGTAVPDVGFNRDRLEILLGKAETDKLAQTLADEQRIAQTNAKLFAGSQTAPRQAVNNLTSVTQVTPGIRLTTPIAGLGGFQVGGLPGAAVGVGLSMAGKGAQKGLQIRDLVRNRLMADAISGDGAMFQNAVAPTKFNKLMSGVKSMQSNLLTGGSAGLSAPSIGQFQNNRAKQ